MNNSRVSMPLFRLQTLLSFAACFGIFCTEAMAGVGFTADLSISKTDGVATADSGSALTYTIIAGNAGPNAVTGATVTDSFPPELTCPTWSCTGSGGGTCAVSGSGNISDATVALPVSATVTYTVQCNVASVTTSDTISNSVIITPPGGTTDPMMANNSANDTDQLIRLVNLSITKSDGSPTAVPGNTVTYQIIVHNAGPNSATTLMTDTFNPAYFSACSWNCVSSNGTCIAGSTGDISDPGSIMVGGSLAYAATCTLSMSATGNISNTANVVDNNLHERDTDTSDNMATDTDTVDLQADVAVTITDNRQFVQVGDTLNYVISVTNSTGPSAAMAAVSDTLPGQLGAASWTCVPSGGATCAGGTGNTLSDTASLPVGGQAQYLYSATVQSEGSGVISNSVIANTTGGVTDPNVVNNAADDTPSDIVYLFKDGFDGTPIPIVLEGFGGSDYAVVQLHVAPTLLATLGIVPQQIATGETALGKRLFSIELARFGNNVAMRVVAADAQGLSERSTWQTVELQSNPLDLAWQSASSAGNDGYVNVAGGSAPVQMVDRSETGQLAQLRIVVAHNTPWLATYSH